MTEAEYRARVLSVGQFDWLEQLTPANEDYDEKGIRRIGGKVNDSEDVKVQSVRFSKDEKFDWTRDKIAEWLEENDFEIDQLKSVKPKPYKRWEGRKQEVNFEIISEFKVINKLAYKPGEDLFVEGIINSDSVDAHDEIVDPDAVMESVPWFMKFPTFRNMHQADSIGVVLKIWKVENIVWAKMRIDAVESKIIQKVLSGTLRAFSIGFNIKKMEQYCPEKDDKGNLICYWKFTKIMLIEISLVDTPANRDAKLTRSQYKSLVAPKWVNDVDEYKTTAIIDNVEPPKIETTDCPDNTCPKGVVEFDIITESEIVEDAKTNIEKKITLKILPKADIERSWDGPAAKKRMRKVASSDGSGDKDKMNWKKYARGFAYVEAGADDFGAFHLPFADVIDGKLKAVWRGVAAAGAAVQGARGASMSTAAKNAAKRKLSPYYKAFGKKPPWQKKDSGVNIHKKVINKPFHDFDTNQLDSIIRGIQMTNEKKIKDDKAAKGAEDAPPAQEPVTQEPEATPGAEEIPPTTSETEAEEKPEKEPETEDKSAAILDAIGKVADSVKANTAEIAKMKMSDEEKAEAEKIDKKVAEQLKERDDELKALKAEKEELEKANAVREEVEKQMEKLPPTKRSLSAESGDANETDDDGFTPKLAKAHKQMAVQLQTYAAPPPEPDDEEEE